jgi:malonate-semialdehyde dehydrogenase (acetylating)/methylmalonate-semialdehyde dehydrogenase
MTTQPAGLADLAPTVKMLLDGKFIESQTHEWHDVVNPATQEALAQVSFATVLLMLWILLMKGLRG